MRVVADTPGTDADMAVLVQVGNEEVTDTAALERLTKVGLIMQSSCSGEWALTDFGSHAVMVRAFWPTAAPRVLAALHGEEKE